MLAIQSFVFCLGLVFILTALLGHRGRNDVDTSYLSWMFIFEGIYSVIEYIIATIILSFLPKDEQGNFNANIYVRIALFFLGIAMIVLALFIDK